MSLNEPDVDIYTKLERIGQGTYGVVYRGRNRRTNKLVAMKKILLENEEEGVPATTVREISMLCEFRHPNIVDLQDVIMEENRLYLIFEFLTMDLKNYLDKLRSAGKIDKVLVKNFMFQICQAMCFCHQRRLLHRDLKPPNILVDANKKILKIADFGLARVIGIPVRPYTHEVVTLWYRAPEVLLGTPRYAMGLDTWSVGCIFAEFFLKKPLFQGDSEIDQSFKIFKFLGTPTDKEWKDVTKLPLYKATFPKWKRQNLKDVLAEMDDQALSLFQEMVIYEPVKRISMRDALNHSYFNDVDISKCPAGNFRGELVLDPFEHAENLPPYETGDFKK